VKASTLNLRYLNALFTKQIHKQRRRRNSQLGVRNTQLSELIRADGENHAVAGDEGGVEVAAGDRVYQDVEGERAGLQVELVRFPVFLVGQA